MFTHSPVNQKSRIWFTTFGTWISRPAYCALCECALCDCSLNEQSLEAHGLSLFCQHCQKALPRVHQPCYQCGLELPAYKGSGNQGIDKQGSVIHRCGACLSTSPVQERCVSPLSYLFPVPDLVSEIKFHQRFHVVKALSHYFSEYCANEYQQDSLPQLILPVPLHPQRAFTRGFNQAYLFSHLISKRMNIPAHDTYLKRIKHTSTQRTLDIKMRKRNVKQAFALAKPIPVNIKHVAIFDDVITTGATIDSVAKTLQETHIERIDFWSLARTPKSL